MVSNVFTEGKASFDETLAEYGTTCTYTAKVRGTADSAEPWKVAASTVTTTTIQAFFKASTRAFKGTSHPSGMSSSTVTQAQTVVGDIIAYVSSDITPRINDTITQKDGRVLTVIIVTALPPTGDTVVCYRLDCKA